MNTENLLTIAETDRQNLLRALAGERIRNAELRGEMASLTRMNGLLKDQLTKALEEVVRFSKVSDCHSEGKM